MNKLLFGMTSLCLSTLTIQAQTSPKEVDFQLSFIAPISTNGMQSHQAINKYSFNIFGGNSYANTHFEFGGIYNVNTHYTKGVQFAGILNYTGKIHQGGVQIAGITNVAKSGNSALQIGGIANYAQEIQGVQLAGIFNRATRVNGLQLGLINSVGKIRGAQFGLINIAQNAEEGTPIGLFNIVKEGGKYEFEVAMSEALHTSVSFRLGTNRFYTIFSTGINYISQDPQYAAGLGLGTHLDWAKGWGNEFELMGYALTEEGAFVEDLNMLTQFKFTVSKQFAGHFKVFLGPVLNMTVSQYTNTEGVLGTSLNPTSIWSNDSQNTRLNAWAGVTGGFRF